MKASGTAPLVVDDALLRSWPLPMPDATDDKEARGRTVVIAGSREMPGAAWLAAVAALRAVPASSSSPPRRASRAGWRSSFPRLA